ncbi:MAG TPA: hypothetical protein VE987_18530 [Polyangiaceae bacterium]|nr:hypothetical protein [Polyangiaceae bacterium]
MTDWVAPLTALGLAAVAACSSSGHSRAATSGGTAGDQTADDASSCGACDGAATSGGNTNPDGLPYPAPPSGGGYGRTPRTAQPSGGSIIENFKFLGYPNAVVGSGLQRISLADYYDPCGKRSKVLHLTVASVWCTPCNQETDAIVAAAQQLASQGVVVIQALEDGLVPGTGATQTDLQGWITKHHSTFTEMLDPDPNPMLGGFFDAAAVPWNCDIDPRTMEILDASTGWAGDVSVELSPALAAVADPPKYPLPVTCN